MAISTIGCCCCGPRVTRLRLQWRQCQLRRQRARDPCLESAVGSTDIDVLTTTLTSSNVQLAFLLTQISVQELYTRENITDVDMGGNR